MLSHAAAAFGLYDAGGNVLRQGQADAVIGDGSLNVGPIKVSWLDVERLNTAPYSIDLELWPGGRLSLSQLGRRAETFTAALRRARNQSRVAGLLAHGITPPDVFAGAVLDGSPQPAEIHIYDTHLTVVPEYGDPYQVVLGGITDVRAADDTLSVIVEAVGARTEIWQLARLRDEFYRSVTKRVANQSHLLGELTGHDVFADGRGVRRSRINGFDRLLDGVTSPDRKAAAVTLVARATDEPRLGFVQLLDRDETVAPPSMALPDDWASFLIVPIGGRSIVEVLAGPAAATYVFNAAADEVNRDLQAMHFRRAPLALNAEQAEITPFNPYRLALRKLEPLKRLRACTEARVIHNDGWTEALRRALGEEHG